MGKENGQSHVYISVGDTTVSEPFKIGVRTGESLYNIARSTGVRGRYKRKV